ncbi:hypothetical protein OAN12_01750 [Halioglobus sp.]|nr:hypothetical protein [Halioglobus sp.]
MKILIDKHDLAKMSVELRNELMQLMFDQESNSTEDFYTEIPNIGFEEHKMAYPEEQQYVPGESADSKSKKQKEVIGISESQARDLIANLSDKSIDTLKHFTTKDSVLIDTLVGKGKPYATFNELKRSFVGPVNRRLRTVTKNKTSVLFKKSEQDGDESKFSVKPETGSSLSKVLS